MRSIITDDLGVCSVCGIRQNIEVHHCIHGIAKRKLSTEYHLVIGLCAEHHRGTNGVHGKNGAKLDNKIKKIAQTAWENKYGNREQFIEIFGRSYL